MTMSDISDIGAEKVKDLYLCIRCKRSLFKRLEIFLVNIFFFAGEK